MSGPTTSSSAITWAMSFAPLKSCRRGTSPAKLPSGNSWRKRSTSSSAGSTSSLSIPSRLARKIPRRCTNSSGTSLTKACHSSFPPTNRSSLASYRAAVPLVEFTPRGVYRTAARRGRTAGHACLAGHRLVCECAARANVPGGVGRVPRGLPIPRRTRPLPDENPPRMSIADAIKRMTRRREHVSSFVRLDSHRYTWALNDGSSERCRAGPLVADPSKSSLAWTISAGSISATRISSRSWTGPVSTSPSGPTIALPPRHMIDGCAMSSSPPGQFAGYMSLVTNSFASDKASPLAGDVPQGGLPGVAGIGSRGKVDLDSLAVQGHPAKGM